MSEENIALPVTGMTCANCAANIERSLNKLNGIQEASVNFASEKANVRFDPGQIDIQAVVDSVERAGYGVVTQHIRTTHHGHDLCQLCSQHRTSPE